MQFYASGTTGTPSFIMNLISAFLYQEQLFNFVFEGCLSGCLQETS